MEETLPQLLLRQFRQYGARKVAMRQKDFGIWRQYTWADVHEHVKSFGLGLVRLGLQRGDKVAIMGDNDPQWFWAELGIQAAGGVVYGVYADTVPHEVRYLLEHGDAKFAVCRDQEQVDKVLEVRPHVPRLETIIYWKPKGLYYYREPSLMFWGEVEELGREFEKEHPGIFEQMIEDGRGDDIAVMCYTSGTTGTEPKGALITHRSMIWNMRLFLSVDRWSDSDRYVPSASPAWLAEQWFGMTCNLLAGVELCYPESSEAVRRDLREVAPTVIFLPSRLWEDLAARIRTGVADAGWLKRRLYYLFEGVGHRRRSLASTTNRLTASLWAALRWLGDWVVFRPLRDRLGLVSVRSAYTAGTSISPEGIRFFRDIGVNLKQLYAATEAGMIAMHHDDDVDPHTVGPPLDPADVAITQQGEVVVKGCRVFSGYYSKSASQEKHDHAGDWVHTGDVGRINGAGHLVYIDRLANLVRLSADHEFSPEMVSSRLRFSGYIKDALLLVSTTSPLVAAVIVINYETVSDWAESNNLPYSTFLDLSQKSEVYDLIAREIKRVNKDLPPHLRVRRFANLHKEFDADEGEMTRTRKVRHSFLAERYSELINAMYMGKESFPVEATITYRDGTVGTLATTLRIRDVEEEH